MLMVLLLIAESESADKTEVNFEPAWIAAEKVAVALDEAIAERDEARQQLDEAREQLHKIGRKAFWAGKAGSPK